MPFACACMNELFIADIDCGVIDLIARIALEEQQIAFFEVVDGIDPGPSVVIGVGIRVPTSDLDAALVQTIMNETGTVKRVRTFVA